MYNKQDRVKKEQVMMIRNKCTKPFYIKQLLRNSKT